MKPINELSDIELREAVAVEVMGWTKLDRVKMGWGEGPQVWGTGDTTDEATGEVRGRHGGPTHQGFEPESSIEAAFEVVGKMREKGWVFFYLSIIPSDGVSRSKATFSRATPLGRKSPVNHDALGATPPRAICIAALTAVRARKA